LTRTTKARTMNPEGGIMHSGFIARFRTHYAEGNGCWLWKGATDKDGYGLVKRDGRMLRAHRVMYELERGPIPGGKLVMHSCDTPGCVRPDHLLLGTPKENTQDMIAKGRRHLTTGSTAQRGTLNGRAKLTEREVKSIRRRYTAGELQIHLAAEFGITQGAVHKIVAGLTWGHLE